MRNNNTILGNENCQITSNNKRTALHKFVLDQNDACPANEEFLTCGTACPAKCSAPEGLSLCTSQCVQGCFCKPGYLRDDNNKCVSADQCPDKYLDKCPSNEEYLTCGTACPSKCSDPEGPSGCTAECVQGCFCKSGYLRDDNNTCVRADQCPENKTPNECPLNEEYLDCGTACPSKCSDPEGPEGCTTECVQGCFCKSGYLRDDNNICVKADQCPENKTPNVCPLNEEYLACGTACPSKCSDPEGPGGCTTECVQGCFCKSGYLRDDNNACVRADQCPENKTPNVCPPNEEFLTCGTACPSKCSDPEGPGGCTTECVQGCFCKSGYLRDDNNACVRADQCPENKTPNECPLNEEYLDCGTACPSKCSDPEGPGGCTTECVQGCFCKSGYLRDDNNICVRADQCPENKTPNVCPPNEEYLACGTACPSKCSDPEGPGGCTTECVQGCFCKPGYLRDDNNICVKADQCPEKLDVCPLNEEFLTCGTACPSKCSDPEGPGGCTTECVQGCFCKSGYLRDDNNACVRADQCPKNKTPTPCLNQNEVYDICNKPCEPSCVDPEPICTKDCTGGCICAPGLLRNPEGDCVTVDKCPGNPVLLGKYLNTINRILHMTVTQN